MFLATSGSVSRHSVHSPILISVRFSPSAQRNASFGAPELTLTQAEERLDASGERFVFFVNPDTGRGNVVYLRYDGHYGVITPA